MSLLHIMKILKYSNLVAHSWRGNLFDPVMLIKSSCWAGESCKSWKQPFMICFRHQPMDSTSTLNVPWTLCKLQLSKSTNPGELNSFLSSLRFCKTCSWHWVHHRYLDHSGYIKTFYTILKCFKDIHMGSISWEERRPTPTKPRPRLTSTWHFSIFQNLIQRSISEAWVISFKDYQKKRQTICGISNYILKNLLNVASNSMIYCIF